MNFPLEIQDERQLARLFRSASQDRDREIVHEVLVQCGLKKGMMTKSELIKRTTEAKVRGAIKTGRLKFVSHWEKSWVDAEKWIYENKYFKK